MASTVDVSLRNQFAKSVLVDKDANSKGAATLKGTVKVVEGALYVVLDGSNILTPVKTTVAAKEDDRVEVRIYEHQATITGNYTDKSIGDETAKSIVAKALNGFVITNSNFIDGTIDGSIFTNGTIKGSQIDFSTFQNGVIEGSAIKGGTITAAEIKGGTITGAQIQNGTIDETKIKQATFEKLEGDIITAVRGEFNTVLANKVDSDYVTTNFAKIDFSNITSASIEKLFADSGIIKDLVMSDGHVTGELVGVTIKGDLIEGNTIVADKLVIKGEDGLFYKLNTNGETVGADQTDENSLNGSVITAKSVTAEKITVNDLVAFDATIGGFEITEETINSINKGSVNAPLPGVYMDKSGQIALGDDINYLKYYKDDDGDWQLALSAQKLVVSTTGTDVSEIAESAEESANMVEQLGTSINNRLESFSSDIDAANNNVVQLADRVEDSYDQLSVTIQKINSLSQSMDGWNFQFQELTNIVNSLDGDVSNELVERLKYIRFVDGNMELGNSESPIQLVVKNDRIAFEQDGSEVAYISNSRLYITDATITDSLDLGKFKFVPRKNGNLSFRWVG